MTRAWLVIAALGFVVVAQSYLVAAFRVIDSGSVAFAAVPLIGMIVACTTGGFVWVRSSSLNSGFRALALTLLAFDFAALGFLAAAAPFLAGSQRRAQGKINAVWIPSVSAGSLETFSETT